MQRSKPEALRPDQSRSEGTPSLSERAERRSKTFWLLLRRLSKVTRCKSETASRSTRRNGYSHSQPEHGRLSGRHREQAHSYRKANRSQQKTRRQSLICRFPVPAEGRSEILQPPHFISRRLVRVTQLQSRHHITNQRVTNHKLNLPLLNPLNLPRLTNERLTAVQRPKLTRPKHLPSTVVIVPDPPTTGSEYSVLDHLDMTVRNKKPELVHRPQFTQTRALRNMRIQGASSVQSSERHEFCTARNTRSGCGIMIVTRPSRLVRPVIPRGEPFGLAG